MLEVSEFRPISLTQVIAKIMESLINKELSKICEERRIFPDFQRGFRKGMSTMDNLKKIQQNVHETFKKKEIMIAAFLDIKKAYDSVDRLILNKVIQKMPLDENLKAYLGNFLCCIIMDHQISFNI